MKTVLIALTSLISISAMANVECASTGKVDNIAQIRVSQDSENVLIATVTNTASETKNFVSTGSLKQTKYQLSQDDKGPFGIDRVYLEKTAKGYAIVKINQCSFSYQEETCSSQEDEQFSEVSRDTNVACVVTN